MTILHNLLTIAQVAHEAGWWQTALGTVGLLVVLRGAGIIAGGDR